MSTAKILIVDDEPSNLATLKQILGNDYTLVFARCGTECLTAAKKHQPALILLDIKMPDMDGYTVCRMLKADPLTESTPVIFVSSLGDVGDEAAGFSCGGVDYIVKPVSPSLVLARVRTHLSLVRATTLELYVKQLEIERAKTARLSRILAVLSGTNSTIVRVKEPQALADEACLIAVEQGGFGVAWIEVNENGSESLNLAARKSADGDLPQPSPSALPERDLPLSGPEITEEVLKSGMAVYCNDVRSKVNESRSCRDALQQGYLSIVGLPLTASERTAGVMVLYAREMNYFDDEEMKLLNELAGDISFALQAIKNERRASFLSYYDPLTKLPNTTLFLDRVDQLVLAARNVGGSVFLVALDFDRFKQLNDRLGRHIGDQVLRSVAKMLGENFSHMYSIARVGSDNFVIAGEHISTAILGALCEQIIALFNQPLVIDKHSLSLSVRLGITIYPEDADDGESLFKNAEAALKQCKLVKASYLFYSPQINARIAEKFDLECALRIALDNKQFVLYFQPKVDLMTGRICGAEALIRWRHPERGIVSPLEFIPLAEETGLIVPIGEWVIHAVCEQQAAWLRDAIHTVPVALNLSAIQFKDGDVLGIVREALTRNALDASFIELELTESVVMHDPESAEKTMRALRDLGLRLSLDDFGTGYSSLAHLKRYPFNTVKIDRAFVTDITQNPEDAAIAVAIIGMAHSLNMHVIAEGVETEAQLKFLRTRHCDQMQGYFFSRPVPTEEFAAMLEADKRIELESDTEMEQLTLLVVDDEEPIVSALNRSLHGQGYRILTALNGEQALELLAANTVQVILSDQRMPNMTGTEFLTIAAKLYPDTTRIVLSGYTELQSIMDVINRGEIHRFLTKPWENDLLRKNIREAFRRHRPTA